MQRIEDRCRTANMIGVRVGKHEGVERSSSPEEVRQNDRSTRVSALPRGAGVEQDPPTVRGAKKNCVTLANVEKMHLGVDAVSGRERRNN